MTHESSPSQPSASHPSASHPSASSLLATTPTAPPSWPETATLQAAFLKQGYVASEALAVALRLALALGKPLLLEGPAGVGKTEAAKTLAQTLGTRLIRLQCYEGLDAAAALYEWNYARQLLHLRAAETTGRTVTDADLYGPAFLIRRPLLQAISEPVAPVLLIDEIDRADEAFEAFLLELLAEWQITVPELGTLRATTRPHVLLTSNRARELSDALRRRCLYQWVDYPTRREEERIVRAQVSGISEALARQLTGLVESLRDLPLNKPPGVAETLDWASALVLLHREHLDVEALRLTLGTVLKRREDQLLAQDLLERQLPRDIPPTPPPGLP